MYLLLGVRRRHRPLATVWPIKPMAQLNHRRLHMDGQGVFAGFDTQDLAWISRVRGWSARTDRQTDTRWFFSF